MKFPYPIFAGLLATSFLKVGSIQQAVTYHFYEYPL
jgi:hypothetical protein